VNSYLQWKLFVITGCRAGGSYETIYKSSAVAVTVCLLNVILPFSQLNVFAASIPINVYVDDFSDGDLKIRWDSVMGQSRFV